MKKYLLLKVLGVTMSLFVISSCADKLPEPDTSLDCSTNPISYNSHVKGILNANCNLSGCHDNNALGSFGDFSTLGTARMQEIYNRVAVVKNMPPAGMSVELVDSVRCWSENGYLEN